MNVSPMVASTRTASAWLRRCFAESAPELDMTPWTVPDPAGGWKDITCAPPASRSSVTLEGEVICPGATNPNASSRSLGFSTMPTTRSVRPLAFHVDPTFRSNIVATSAVTAASPSPTGYWPETRCSNGPLNFPRTACARRSTGVIDPGTGTFSWTIASTLPNWRRAAATFAATPSGPRLPMSIRALAVPRTPWSVPCTLTTSPSPTVVAATATVSRVRIRACWRHSRRSSRHAQRRIARRAGAPPPPVGRGTATGGGGGVRTVLIALSRRRAATPVPQHGRFDRRSARHGGISPGPPTRPAVRRG